MEINSKLKYNISENKSSWLERKITETKTQRTFIVVVDNH